MANALEKRTVYLTIAIQILVSIGCLLVASFLGDWLSGLPMLWGVMAAGVNMALLAWRMIYGDRPALSAGQHLRLMYRSSLERFFIVTSLLVIGMLKLKLAASGVILGFLVGQIILVMVPIMREFKVK